MSAENIEKFIVSFVQSLDEKTFVKITLGNYKGNDKHLQRILIRLIETKKGIRLFYLYRYDTRDTAKNYDFDEGIQILRGLLGKDFYAGHLFTTDNDFQLDIGNKGKSRLNTGKPTFKSKPTLDHNRKKRSLVDQHSFYLTALNITDDQGKIRAKQQDKWKQINKFIETLGGLFDDAGLDKQEKIRVVDMGAGKGYLTFAAYDYFKNNRGLNIKITGVDTKSELVELCNGIAESCAFEELKFVHGFIDGFELPKTDVLIALHACNTATDDAIFKGIKANAKLIVVAPCCHQEVRGQIEPPELLKNVLKYGVLLEREAESITDGLRALMLEKSGYSTKVFEFISTEHTPKNNMIVGKFTGKDENSSSFDAEIAKIKDFFGIKTHRLESLLEVKTTTQSNQ